MSNNLCKPISKQLTIRLVTNIVLIYGLAITLHLIMIENYRNKFLTFINLKYP